MDTISHYMVSFVMGRKVGMGNPEIMAFTLGSILPDVDAVAIVGGIDAFKSFHGSYTHSLPIGFVLALVVALAFFIYYKRNVLFYAFGGILMHQLLDIPNMISPARPRIAQLFLPFSDYGIAIPSFQPFQTVVWAVVASAILVFSLYFLVIYVKKGDHPWRIWIDDRKIMKFLKRRKDDQAGASHEKKEERKT
jgi:membrane-bound metal-dependent hydrolase YbcI (DUF457 family)